MTRKERKELTESKHLEFVNSLKGKELNQKEKSKFRSTSPWKTFRKLLKLKRKVDALTGRPLTKTWNLHHIRSDSRLYTDLDERFFLCMNSQQHDIWHTCYEEMLKNPDYLDILKESILLAIKINHGESFIYHKKKIAIDNN